MGDIITKTNKNQHLNSKQQLPPLDLDTIQQYTHTHEYKQLSSPDAARDIGVALLLTVVCLLLIAISSALTTKRGK